VDTRLARLPKAGSTRRPRPAGLARLGRLGEATEVLPESVVLPAVGQGALAIVAREKDAEIACLASLDHAASPGDRSRGALAALQAGCKAPVAALARVEDGVLRITAGVSLRRRRSLREEASGLASDAAAVGTSAAEKLLARGAGADRAGDHRAFGEPSSSGSGANPFVHLVPSPRIEIVEKVSHPSSRSSRRPPGLGAQTRHLTSQVAVERAFGDPARESRQAVSALGWSRSVW
jgi:hypothetical protein